MKQNRPIQAIARILRNCVPPALPYLFTVLFCLHSPNHLGAAEEILINVDEAHPPFMYSKGGRAAGIYPALIETAFKRMQVPIRLEPRPWARAVQEIDKAAAGLAGVYQNSERLGKWAFSQPLLVERIIVYSHHSRPMAFTTIDDLRGKRVGVMRGWSYGNSFDSARKSGLFQIEEVGSDIQNFQKIEMGRIDVFLAIPESVTTLLSHYTSIDHSATPLAEAPAFLAFAKAANRQGLLDQFNLAIKEMRESGEFQRIINREFGR